MALLRSRRQALGGASCRALVELRAELLQSLVELLQSFARSVVEIRAPCTAPPVDAEACNCIPPASIVRSRLQNRYIRYVQSFLQANRAIFAILVGVKQLPYKQGVKSLKLVVVG